MDATPVCSSFRYADGVTTAKSHSDSSAQSVEQPSSTIRLRDASLAKLMDSMTKEIVTYLEAKGHVKVATHA